MLKCFFFDFTFVRFSQSGFFFDFFYKKITEVFVRNVLIYAAQFFGEKYVIEYMTKKIFDKIIFSSNKFVFLSNLKPSYFFYQIGAFFFYCLFIISTLYIFL